MERSAILTQVTLDANANHSQQLTIETSIGSKDQATIADRAREHAQLYVTEAIEALVRVMRQPDVPPQTRVQAANALLDRAIGKPGQEVSVSSQTIDLSNLHMAALQAANRAAADRAALTIEPGQVVSGVAGVRGGSSKGG